MVPFEAEKFEPFMESTVQPWLAAHVQSGQFPGYDGRMLQFYHAEHPDAKGVIVMLHGFCGFFGKYHEVVYDFWEKGYTIYFLEHRGHGQSYRPVSNPDMVDVSDFEEYVEDLKCFVDGIIRPEQTADLFLYAHSMGGCIATMFLERYPDVFRAAILTSPMLNINFGSTPYWKVKLTAVGTRILGWNDRYVPGQGDFDGKDGFEESGASCRERYEYSFRMRTDPEYQRAYTTNGASCRWARASLRAIKSLREKEAGLNMPILILQAGHDTFVDNKAENHLRKTAKHALLVRFPEAKHEIFNSEGKTLEKYYQTIFRFLDRYTQS